ncbi:restriction endonuclease subunit S [Allobaculum sp. JKK-2023]|uniref:restriction endonuclease subunit S n=1 Tax=Allobaculum sp. JKK-2023 TaxID=3108943 RepID=UPI002B05A71A|nr:restriction endonuclease subunit S [Allobaculum sp. JKK-2023]
MNESRIVKLSEVCDIVSGSTPKTNILEYWEGNLKWITPAEITDKEKLISDTERHISAAAVCQAHLRLLPKGTVLFSSRAPIGKVAIAGEEMYCNQGFKNLVCSSEILNEYLYYYLKYNADYIKSIGRGATFKEVSKEQVGNLTIVLPEISEQLRRSKVLSLIDRLIENYDKQLGGLSEIQKSRFIEMFGDPKLNDKGWKSGLISDYFYVKGGKRIPKGMGYANEITKHPYLRATDMKNETIVDDDVHYIDDEVYAYIKKYTVKEGDIYLTNVGVNLGMAGIIPRRYDGANLTENAVKLVPRTEKEIEGLFLAYYINSPGIQDYINERKMSVGVPKLAIFRIETMPVLVPPLEMQNKFISFYEHINKSKLAIQKSIDELETLKKSLMQEYFG